jgi:hypothetical protein
MPIRDLLSSGTFSPDEVATITAAYEESLRALGLVDRADPAATMVAKRLLEIAAGGERDPMVRFARSSPALRSMPCFAAALRTFSTVSGLSPILDLVGQLPIELRALAQFGDQLGHQPLAFSSWFRYGCRVPSWRVASLTTFPARRFSRWLPAVIPATRAGARPAVRRLERCCPSASSCTQAFAAVPAAWHVSR